jgi:hypothetical protein
VLALRQTASAPLYPYRRLRSQLCGKSWDRFYLRAISKRRLEEMIREVILQNFRADVAERALAWLDRKIATKH